MYLCGTSPSRHNLELNKVGGGDRVGRLAPGSRAMRDSVHGQEMGLHKVSFGCLQQLRRGDLMGWALYKATIFQFLAHSVCTLVGWSARRRNVSCSLRMWIAASGLSKCV